MNSDCYAILGVSPAAEDVVIRAAYLALMRRYHPDRNISAEAAARARAITHAYAELGDPVRRAEYDARREASQFDILGYVDKEERPPPPRRRAPLVGGIAAAALALFLVVTVPPLTQLDQTNRARKVQPGAQTKPAPAPSAARARPAADLPAQTLPVASTDEPQPIAPARGTAGPTPPRVEVPIKSAMRTRPLPPKAEAATRPLTQARAPAERSSTASTPPPSLGPNDAKFAALDRHSALLYGQSLVNADAEKRPELQRARDRFLEARKECRSETCVTDAYLGHMREVGEIMEASEQPVP